MTEVVAPAVAGIAVGLFLVNILEDSYESDKCALDLEKSKGQKGFEKIDCGNNGVDCLTACSNVRGNIGSASSSNCLRYVYGDDPDAQAEEHCKRAKQNPNYCKSGY